MNKTPTCSAHVCTCVCQYAQRMYVSLASFSKCLTRTQCRIRYLAAVLQEADMCVCVVEAIRLSMVNRTKDSVSRTMKDTANQRTFFAHHMCQPSENCRTKRPNSCTRRPRSVFACHACLQQQQQNKQTKRKKLLCFFSSLLFFDWLFDFSLVFPAA